MYLERTEAILLLYSVSCRQTFEKIPHFLSLIEEARKGKERERERDLPVILIGNKCDVDQKEREVWRREGEEMARVFGISFFFETSAKTNENVEQVFVSLVQMVLNRTIRPLNVKSAKRREN